MHDHRSEVAVVKNGCAGDPGHRRGIWGLHSVWLGQGLHCASYAEPREKALTLNQSLSPLNAALLNGSFIQGFELDDVHVDAPWHANSVILPALFAAAEHTGKKDSARIDGPSFLLSTIVGFETGSRVGRALRGSDMLSRGWHSVSVQK